MHAVRELKISDVLRLYAEGRRDFKGLSIGPDEETFDNQRLDDADFSSSFVDARFAGAGLRHAKFVNANVKGCVFDRADLTGATFAGAALDSASFVRADLEGTVFAGATSHSHIFLDGEIPDERTDRAPIPGRHERFRRALDSTDVKESLYALAAALRDEGETESEVLGLFSLFQSDHHGDQDEALYDAILDTMDLVAGWCRPDAAIFKRS
jgi:uncharacterized protein YjbI with pentapeptide repeats